MTIKTENWLGEYTSTIGTGDITLGGAIDGFAGFSNVGENVDVYYTVMDALDKETGIGTLTGGKLVRKDIHATLVDGTYVKNGSAIKLSGDAQVYGTANAHFLDYVQAVANAEIVNTQAIAELKALQINGHALTASFNLTAADVGAHPDSWMPSTEALNVYQKDVSDIRYLKTQDAEQVAGLVMRVGGAREQQLQQSINDVSTAFIGDAPPAGAPVGKRWFDTESGRTYIKYNDGDSTQWVEESPQGLSPDGLEPRIDEALRRSYADMGYNVVGTFQAGFTIVNANDVGIDETTGKGYTGPAGHVSAGTDQASGGFVDRSGELLRRQTELALSSTAEMVQKAIVEQGLAKRFSTGGTSWNLLNTSLPITMDNFRAFNAIYVDDLHDDSGDYSDALQAAIDKAFIDGCDVFLGGGTKRITRTIIIPMGLNYQHQGTHIYGMGRGKSVLDFDNVNRGSYAIAGFQQKAFDATHGYANCTLKDFSMTNSYGNPSDISAHILMASATGCLWDNLHLSQCVTGIHFTDDAWLNSFTNIFIAPRDYGFRMDNSGTTNWWHGLFVHGSNVTAYKLRSGYSAIGALAADDCTGTAYDLRFFRGSVGSLGTEQPTQGRVLSKLLSVDNGSISIGSLLAFRGVPNSGSWVGVEVGAGQVSIDDFVVDSHDQTAGDKVSTGRLINGFTGDIKIRNLVIKKDSNGVNAGTLTMAASTLQNTVVSIENPNGTAVAVAGDGHPAIAGSRYNVSPFANITSKGQIVQSIVFDNYGSPKHGGSTLDNKYQFANGYQAGSIFLENNPLRWGCAGYVATNTSPDINGQTTIPIAAVNTTAPTAPHVGVSYFDTVTSKPYWWNGSVWKDAAGVTKP